MLTGRPTLSGRLYREEASEGGHERRYSDQSWLEFTLATSVQNTTYSTHMEAKFRNDNLRVFTGTDCDGGGERLERAVSEDVSEEGGRFLQVSMIRTWSVEDVMVSF